MSRRRQSDWIWLTSLLIVALALRLGAAVWWQSRQVDQFAFGDSESYWVLGQRIADGKSYQYGSEDARVFRTPGYPILLAGMFRLVGDDASVMWGRGLGAVLGTATVAAVYALARLLYGGRTAILAAAFTAVYPSAIALSIFVLSEALFCPMMVMQLLLWTVCYKAPTARRRAGAALATGVIAGLAVLVRPSWLLFTPLAIGFGLVTGPARGRRLALGALMMLGLVVAMAPWWIRNGQITGRFIPTTLQVGASLYDGLNPRADGSSEMSFVARFEREVRGQPSAAGDDVLEYRLDRRLREEALGWARQHPAQVARLAGVKFIRLWNIWPNEPQFRSVALRLVMMISYLPLLALAIYGAWRLAGRSYPSALCWLPAVYFTMLHVVFVSSVRYRGPAMLGLMVLAAAAVTAYASTRHVDPADQKVQGT